MPFTALLLATNIDFVSKQIDRTLANSLESLLEYVQPKDGLGVSYFLRATGLMALINMTLYYKAKPVGSIEDLCLDFTYPGHDIELCVCQRIIRSSSITDRVLNRLGRRKEHSGHC